MTVDSTATHLCPPGCPPVASSAPINGKQRCYTHQDFWREEHILGESVCECVCYLWSWPGDCSFHWGSIIVIFQLGLCCCLTDISATWWKNKDNHKKIDCQFSVKTVRSYSSYDSVGFIGPWLSADVVLSVCICRGVHSNGILLGWRRLHSEFTCSFT